MLSLGCRILRLGCDSPEEEWIWTRGPELEGPYLISVCKGWKWLQSSPTAVMWGLVDHELWPFILDIEGERYAVCESVWVCVNIVGSWRVCCNWWHFGSYMVNGDFNFLRAIIPLNTDAGSRRSCLCYVMSCDSGHRHLPGSCYLTVFCIPVNSIWTSETERWEATRSKWHSWQILERDL